ncbi:DivIVA domain-containing protein [Bombiscardovia coagulans]|uniref:Cell division protein DivIVA n=1 Tax=Bombiscardovia coagulans TaxID=686666 RepID=A0A261EPC1_9BIFI|nr:DivIVA domain-containing protein [Bombiscardovia coagulans]OZG48701.1 cell division protein DivIVA [Bombiscardovia coagulans]
MAHEPESNRSDATIARAGKRKWGYDIQQVDTFLSRAHKLYESDVPKLTQRDIGNISFDLRKNGYIISQVDAALARLERAVSDRYTSWQINQYGRQQWLDKAITLQQQLSVHALRAYRERFAPGRSGDPSYDRKQVDRLVDQVIAKTASQLGIERTDNISDSNLVDITADRVSNVIFTQRKGKHGYDERQVDYFFVRVVELLQQLESYIRLGDGEQSGTDSDEEIQTHVTHAKRQKKAVSPASHAVRKDTPQRDINNADTIVGMSPLSADKTDNTDTHSVRPVDAAEEAQFDQLHQVEQAIFDGSASAQTPVLAPPAPAPVPVPSPASSKPSGSAKAVSPSLAALAKTPTDETVNTPVESASRTVPMSQSRLSQEPVTRVGEETTQFNPLTDWDDDTDGQQPSVPAPAAPATRPISSKGGQLPQDPPRNTTAPMPAPKESLFDFELPQVDVDIPNLAFPAYDDDETRNK